MHELVLASNLFFKSVGKHLCKFGPIMLDEALGFGFKVVMILNSLWIPSLNHKKHQKTSFSRSVLCFHVRIMEHQTPGSWCWQTDWESAASDCGCADWILGQKQQNPPLLWPWYRWQSLLSSLLVACAWTQFQNACSTRWDFASCKFR